VAILFFLFCAIVFKVLSVNLKRRSNPPGKGMKNQTVYMPIELAEKLKRLATESGLSINDFCRAILEDYANRNAIIHVETRVSFPHEGSVPVEVLAQLEKLPVETILEKAAEVARARVLRLATRKKSQKAS
jgi:hypothetical protein